MPKISIIVAIAEMNAIGQNNDLLTHISSDLKRFKALTSGHPIIMGRKTFDSLPNGPLPNRKNIVLSRNTELKIDGAEVVHSIDDALQLCGENEEVFVIGGATVYGEFLPQASKLYLTIIDQFYNYADTFFPEIKMEEWHETYREDISDDNQNDFNYTFLELDRKRK